MSDLDLLRQYARDGSQAAFAELVDRHLNLVYSAARRQVRSPQLAEEVAQSVFIDLARNARRVVPAMPLVAWLHVVARRTAIDLVRREARRRAREQQAAEIESVMNPDVSCWAAVEPLLDEAVESLGATDRTAVLLRYFENKSLRDVGATLGTSDDAAQKRVSRAIEQLRAFFLRRGIAVTVAGLATDLSAHALQIAPAGLGLAISGAAVLPFTTVATLETSRVLAMTTLQKSIAVAAFVAVGGAGLFEAAFAARRSDMLRLLGAQIERATAEIHALRSERDAAAARLNAVERQIDARLGPAASASSADGALEAQMKEWFARIDRLKQILVRRPELNIPELQLLTDDQWFNLIGGEPLDTDEAVREATSRLRHMAENTFAGKLSAALRAYLKAHAGVMPGSPTELAPHFEPPVDRAILERYEISPSDDIPGAPSRAREKILTVKAPADPELDAFWWVGADSYGNTTALGVDFEEAMRRFTAANPGQRPTSATQIRPYLKWPVRDEAVQKLQQFLDYKPNSPR
jgi:RNA polymerase sigma factor (sigma-70 family)